MTHDRLRRISRATVPALALLAFLAPRVQAMDFLPEPAVEENASSYSHHYGNCRYGFNIDMPKGYTGYDETELGEQSGVGVILSKGRIRAHLASWAKPDEVGFKDLDEAAGVYHMVACKQRGGIQVSEGRSKAQMHGREARRLVLECRSEGRSVIDDSVTFLHPERKVLYVVGLRVDKEAYAQYLPLFEEFLASWRLTEMGCQ